MKITQHGPNLKQISFGGSVFPLNCYLVQDEDGSTLIDTALGLLSKSLLQAIRQHATPLRRIVITHGHMDHADGIAAVQAAFPEAKLCVGQREYLLMTGDRRTVPGEPGNQIGGSFYQLKSKPHRLLATGDRVGSLEVLNAAGHSPGQIALRDERDGTLLAGDAFHTVGGLTPVTHFRFRFPWPYFANWNPLIAQATADRLLSLEISRIAPGHGPVVEISEINSQPALQE
jgi:glyoxylase-like metal-dependent hydrolase (beta-lactamase superfamily II)